MEDNSDDVKIAKRTRFQIKNQKSANKQEEMRQMDSG